MNAKFACLACAILLTSSVAIANDDRAPNELSLAGVTQFTRPALGLANFGATPTMQSSKISFGGSLEYRRWFGNNGFAFTYSVVASDADFSSVPASWQMSLTRHEGVLSYLRKLFPRSRLNAYLSLGAGGFVTHGGFGWRLNGVWQNNSWLGLDGQFQLRAATGFDLFHTRHFAIRTGYVAHWTRAPNFSDVTYHAARTFITEPQLALVWKF